MSVTGLGLEWVRRKHPELRPEHPGHRRQRFCRAADAEQLAHAAALRESSLQKREAAACRCRRRGARRHAAAAPDAGRLVLPARLSPPQRSTTRGSCDIEEAAVEAELIVAAALKGVARSARIHAQ